MAISPIALERNTGIRFFNFAVDSALTEDYLAIYRWTRRQSPYCKILLVGLDVEALNDEDEFDARLIGNSALISLLPPLKLKTVVAFRASQALSLMDRHFAQDVLRSLRIANNSNLRVSGELSAFDPDGLLHYPQWEKQVAAGTFKLANQLSNSRDEYRRRFANMKSISKRRSQDLETLIKEAQQDGVTIYLWITPLHPDTTSYLSANTQYAPLLERIRAYCQQLERQYQIRTFDFSEPARFQGNSSDWWDGAHIQPANAARIVQLIIQRLKKDGL